MKRSMLLIFAVLLSVMSMGSAVAAESTPEASAESSPAASPMASPTAGSLEEGEWEYESANNILNIQITEMPANAPADATLDMLVAELETQEIEGATYEGTADAPENCRLLEYSVDGPAAGASIYVMACIVDDHLVLIMSLDDELVLDVYEAIEAGETDYVPEGFELVSEDN